MGGVRGEYGREECYSVGYGRACQFPSVFGKGDGWVDIIGVKKARFGIGYDERKQILWEGA